MRHFIFALIVSFFMLTLAGGGTSAHAACANPVASGGDIIFNSSHSVLQYCDDSNWQSFPRRSQCNALGTPVQRASFFANDITYGNGMFVAVGADGPAGQQVHTSVDGITWVPRANVPPNGRWRAVVYANDIFVAVGPNYFGTSLMTSDDGINWTARTPANGNHWNYLAYGNGRFVALAENGVMSSPNGITWTAHAVPSALNGWHGLAFGNGRFVAVAERVDSENIMYSDDGMTWHLAPAPAWAATDGHYRGVTYGGGQFLVIASSQNSFLSTDGVNWTRHAGAMPANGGWQYPTYGNGLYVTGTWHHNYFATSPNGINWSTVTMPGGSADGISAIGYHAGRFIVVNAGTNNVYTADCFDPSAACTRPGRLTYNVDHRVMQWCDGMSWHAAGPVAPAGPMAGCTNPVRGAGAVVFNEQCGNLQYCDGDNWRKIGPPIDPCKCGTPASLGMTCGDGSYYVGLSPDGNVPMFMVTAANEITGAFGTEDVSTGQPGCAADNLAASCRTGEANTIALAALEPPQTMARYCNNLVAHGHDDWYVPSKMEMRTIIDNMGQPPLIADMALGNIYYWTSSESAADPQQDVWQISFWATHQSGNKGNNGTNPMRCIRKNN